MRETRYVPAGTELYESVFRRLAWVAMVSNVLGAIVVFVFLAFLLPSSVTELEGGTPIWVNAIVLAVFAPAGLFAGGVWSRRRGKPLEHWLASEQPADPAMRALVLEQPLRFALLSAFFWLLATVVFTAVNYAPGGTAELSIALTIVLGGLSTCALQYLLAERIMRPITARALTSGPPERPLPGVTARLTMAWTLATGVPVSGVAMVTLMELMDEQAGSSAGAALFLAAVALVVGLAAMLFAARSVADPIGAVRNSLARVQAGDFDARVPVDDGSEVGLLQSGFNRMAEGLGERERLRDLFGRHVGDDVARAALNGDVALGGEEREVAALFVDVVGSTALAAHRPATEVVEALNAFFAIVVEVTEAHGGFVNKFEGDGALCVFGAPVARPDPAGDALAAARELRDRLRERGDVDFGIGISAGRSVAGNVGAERRFEYTVIGDPVNEAARLCDLAKGRPERLLASDAALARAAADEQRRWRLGETVELRGRAAETRVAVPA